VTAARDPAPAFSSSFRTGLRVIETVLEREVSGRGGFNVSRLADEVGMERSKASRMTQELCDKGWLERREDATLRVSREFLALAGALDAGPLRRARAVLRRLAVQYGAGARLSVRDGVLVRLLRSESASASAYGAADQWRARAGLITPCWCTGSGRALLLDHTEQELADLLDGYELIGVGGPHAARSVADLVRANDRDRPGGVVAAHGEFEHGVTEYAVPVRDSHSRIRAALAVLGPGPVLAADEPALRADLTAAAGELGALFQSGKSPDRPGTPDARR